MCPTSGDRTLIVRFETGRGQGVVRAGPGRVRQHGSADHRCDRTLRRGLPERDEFDDIVTNTLVARKGSVEMLVAAVASVEAEKALVTKVMASVG